MDGDPTCPSNLPSSTLGPHPTPTLALDDGVEKPWGSTGQAGGTKSVPRKQLWGLAKNVTHLVTRQISANSVTSLCLNTNQGENTKGRLNTVLPVQSPLELPSETDIYLE